MCSVHPYCTEPEFVNLLRGPEIDSQPGGIDPWNRFMGYLKRYCDEKIKG
jgi:hypothetical protein